MAKSYNNVVTHGLSGKVGDLLVFRQRLGKTLVAKLPSRSGVYTEAQMAHREKFRAAAYYAKSVMANPERKQLYQQGLRPGGSVFGRALGDFMKAPQVQEVSTASYDGSMGSEIQISAFDDFLVHSVAVQIKLPNGSLLEEGLAVQPDSTSPFIYKATVQNNAIAGSIVEVQVTDLPGNKTNRQIIL
ncbi:MAG TPA: hypothetical protein VEA58_02565 [Anaerovoracaceae bacterium]|nr:hypothetical protein [Anaerovoracaceae bacterium]